MIFFAVKSRDHYLFYNVIRTQSTLSFNSLATGQIGVKRSMVPY